jgi:hypothetical protein
MIIMNFKLSRILIMTIKFLKIIINIFELKVIPTVELKIIEEIILAKVILEVDRIKIIKPILGTIWEVQNQKFVTFVTNQDIFKDFAMKNNFYGNLNQY